MFIKPMICCKINTLCTVRSILIPFNKEIFSVNSQAEGLRKISSGFAFLSSRHHFSLQKGSRRARKKHLAPARSLRSPNLSVARSFSVHFPSSPGACSQASTIYSTPSYHLVNQINPLLFSPINHTVKKAL